MYAFSPSWSESPGHWHHILGAISLTHFMKEFLHSVAGVALCRGDNKGIPRMPCVICTARLRKSLPAPGSPPHCWFSGTHPHPGAINAGSLLCRGGGEWSRFTVDGLLTKGHATVTTGPGSAAAAFAQYDFKCPLHTTAGADVSSARSAATRWQSASPLYVRPLSHTKTRCTHCALRRWHETQSVWSSGPQKEISLVKTYIVTTMNTFFAFYVFMKWISSCRNLRCKINI